VDASGNQVTVIGDGNTSTGDSAAGDGSATGTGAGNTTSGTDGNGSGNQTEPAASAPVDAGENQVTVIGDGNTADNTTTEGNPSGSTDGNTTSGENGNGSGNQTEPAASAPVDAGENQVTVIGDGNTSQTADDETGTGGSGGSTTDGQDGTGAGNQTAPGFEAPVDSADNQVTIVGDGNSNARDTESSAGEEDTDSDQSGDQGGDQGAGQGASSGSNGDSASDNAGSDGSGSLAAPSQGGPAASVAGVLPQTGVSAGLMLWGAFGLMMLLLGLALVSGQRRRPAVVLVEQEVTPVS
jgi:LPXTG-motif cell wall-anchored protein